MVGVTQKQLPKKNTKKFQKFFFTNFSCQKNFKNFLNNCFINLYNIYFTHQNRFSRFQEKSLSLFYFPSP